MRKQFWWPNPLSARSLELLEALYEAHDKAARRNNISTVTLINAYVGSGDYLKAVSAALLTFGATHAPLEQTYDMLSAKDPLQAAVDIYTHGGKVPGWGNSFVKGGIDAEWARLDGMLDSSMLNRITKFLHSQGKMIYPNPSAYTCEVAIELLMPKAILPYLLIQGRINAWSQIILGQVK